MYLESPNLSTFGFCVCVVSVHILYIKTGFRGHGGKEGQKLQLDARVEEKFAINCMYILQYQQNYLFPMFEIYKTFILMCTENECHKSGLLLFIRFGFLVAAECRAFAIFLLYLLLMLLFFLIQ